MHGWLAGMGPGLRVGWALGSARPGSLCAARPLTRRRRHVQHAALLATCLRPGEKRSNCSAGTTCMQRQTRVEGGKERRKEEGGGGCGWGDGCGGGGGKGGKWGNQVVVFCVCGRVGAVGWEGAVGVVQWHGHRHGGGGRL